jgi:transposase-like protein/IS1 family transposase
MTEATSTMMCPNCKVTCKRFGRHRNELQRYRCLNCRKTFTEAHERGFRIEGYLQDPRGIMAIQLLVEGCSIRTVERITGIRAATVCELLVIPGQRCELLMNSIRNVEAKDIECDEIWGYVGKKEGHKTMDEYENDTIGDAWAWVALERNTKLVLAFTVGKRTLDHAMELMFKVRRATSPSSRFQLTTDGLKAYVAAVDEMLGDRCDFAQLIKFYSQPRETEPRYSPAEIVEAVPVVVNGDPDPNRICTSHVERQNHADPPIDTTNECLQQENGEPPSGYRAALCVL